MPNLALAGDRPATAGNGTCPTRPEPARRAPDTLWTRQSVDVRRRPRPPLAISLRQQAPLDDQSPPDTRRAPRERRRRRPGPRLPATLPPERRRRAPTSDRPPPRRLAS
jgi:hypothetical protein